MSVLGVVYLASVYTALGLAVLMTLLAAGQLVALLRLPFAIAVEAHLRRHGPESYRDQVVSPLVGAVLGALLGGLVSDLLVHVRAWTVLAVIATSSALLAAPLLLARLGAPRAGHRHPLARLHRMTQERPARPVFDALVDDLHAAVVRRRQADRRARARYVVLVPVLLATAGLAMVVNALVADRVGDVPAFQELRRVMVVVPVYGWVFGLLQVVVVIPLRQRFAVRRLHRFIALVEQERSRARARRSSGRPARGIGSRTRGRGGRTSPR